MSFGCGEAGTVAAQQNSKNVQRWRPMGFKCAVFNGPTGPGSFFYFVQTLDNWKCAPTVELEPRL